MTDLAFNTSHRNGLLFVSQRNSTRSQFAEGFAKYIGPAEIQYYSAGLEPGIISPYAIRAMKEVGIDLSKHVAKGLGDVPMDHIATIVVLCDEKLPPVQEEIHVLEWPVPDPSLQFSDDDPIYAFRSARDEVRALVSRLF